MHAQRSPSGTPTGAGASLGYMPQLDGLRAIAVAMVVVSHYSEGAIDTGTHGVHLFFVLSGFLITGILLQNRASIQSGAVPGPLFSLGRFYARRTLRIFPIYYLVLLVGMAWGVEEARAYAPWLLTYTINWKMAADGWFLAYFAHLWTLAVEEQFYLFWPLVVLLVRPAWLLPAAVAMTLTGPLFRLWHVLGWHFWGNEAHGITLTISTLSAFDKLGVGALLAIAFSRAGALPTLRRAMLVVGPLAAALLLIRLPFPGAGWGRLVVGDTLMAVLFGWIILHAATGFGGMTGRVLSARPLVFIGTISYGIYLYHQLVPPVLRAFSGWSGVPLPAFGVGQALLFAAATLLVSTLSAFAFERPINGLKSRFAYVPAGSGAEPEGARQSRVGSGPR